MSPERGPVRNAEVSDQGLLDQINSLYAAFAQPDVSWVPDQVSRADPIVIGTDQSEWWEGYDFIREAWRKSREEAGGTSLHPTRLQTRIHGDIAWVVDEPNFTLIDGAAGVFRLTMVFTHETDGWRLLHLHASIPVPNELLTAPHTAKLD